MTLRILIVLIASIAASTCLGYVLGISWLWSWGIDESRGMPINTAVALVALAVAIAALLELILDRKSSPDE